jgi:hypothetical protein
LVRKSPPAKSGGLFCFNKLKMIFQPKLQMRKIFHGIELGPFFPHEF